MINFNSQRIIYRTSILKHKSTLFGSCNVPPRSSRNVRKRRAVKGSESKVIKLTTTQTIRPMMET